MLYFPGNNKEVWGNISEIISQIDEVKGEIVIVLEGNTNIDTYDELDILEHIDIYINQGYNQKDAIKMVAKQRGLNKNDVYMKYHSKEWFYEINCWFRKSWKGIWKNKT